MITNTMDARLNEIKRGIVDNGNKLFINNPKKIKKDILSPTDNTNLSADSILFNFSICRSNNPGRYVRKINPNICLKNGIFKRIVKSVRISAVIINQNSITKFLLIL